MRVMLALSMAMWLSAVGYAVTQQGTGVRQPADRFDFAVRADFFAGFQGDRARFDRAMSRCEEELAKNPDHAEALVWRGSGLMSLSGNAFQAGDFQKGMRAPAACAGRHGPRCQPRARRRRCSYPARRDLVRGIATRAAGPGGAAPEAGARGLRAHAAPPGEGRLFREALLTPKASSSSASPTAGRAPATSRRRATTSVG